MHDGVLLLGELVEIALGEWADEVVDSDDGLGERLSLRQCQRWVERRRSVAIASRGNC